MIDNYNGGYTQALLHTQNAFEKMIAQGIPINRKTVMTFMKMAIVNRQEFRETGFIDGLVWNKNEGFTRPGKIS